MHLKLALLASLLFVTFSNSVVVNRDDVVVKDLRLFVEEEEFWIKAMSYQPTPLGRQDMNQLDETGGSGLCSGRQTPFGDTSIPNPQVEYKSACYDSDYYDGSDLAYRQPRGPIGGWFRGLWERDLPVMVDLGVNTLRIYTINPITYQASREQLGTGAIAFPLGKEHISFMDYLDELGLKVIFPLPASKDTMLNSDVDDFQRALMNIIDEVGNHSALLMYTLGNELGLVDDPDDPGMDETLIRLSNKHIAFAREYQQTKWGRNVPITTAEVDYPSKYHNMVETLDVDVFTSNAGYRGPGFTDLWSGNGRDFEGFLNLSCTYDIPLFIGEWGWESINNSHTYEQPNWFNEKYYNLVSNIESGCIGGCFFEFNDEIQKEAENQQTMGVVKFAESDCSRVENCWAPDLLVEKDFIFDAVKEGTWREGAYNYNSDVFELIGRPRIKLEESTRPSICDPFTKKERNPIYPTNVDPTGSEASESPVDGSSASYLVSSLSMIVTLLFLVGSL